MKTKPIVAATDGSVESLRRCYAHGPVAVVLTAR